MTSSQKSCPAFCEEEPGEEINEFDPETYADEDEVESEDSGEDSEA